MFKANGYDPAGGFEGYYTTSNVGMKEVSGVSGVTISPNPASSFTIVRLLNENALDLQISISDMNGKTMSTEVLTGTQGSVEKTIRLDGFKAGVYSLNIKSSMGTTSKKLIIQ